MTTPMPRIRRTADERQHAIDLAVEHGPAEAARRTGIPPGTIAAWCSRAGLATVATERTAAAVAHHAAKAHEKREQLRSKLLDKAADMLDRMDEPVTEYKGNLAREVQYPRPPAADCKNYAVAAAILIDKLRLESGEVTDRHEHSDARQAHIDQARLRLVG